MQPFPYLLLSRKQENPRTVCLARHVTITPTTTHPSVSHINYSLMCVCVQTRPSKTFRHVCPCEAVHCFGLFRNNILGTHTIMQLAD